MQTGAKDKTPVLGMLERNNKVEGRVLHETANGKSIKPILFDKIKKSATVITDGFGAYHNIDQNFKRHIIINHHQDEYVVGDFHTNTIEGFWSLLKRGIIGIYHFTSDKHLQKYVDEFTFRYNSRHVSTATRFNAMLSDTEHRLTYKDLISE